MRHLVALLATIGVLATFGLDAQAPNPLDGTWRLNLTKSKFSPPELTPKSGTSRIEVVQDRIKMTTDGVNAKGQVTHTEYEARFDGKDYPWKGTVDGKPNLDTDAVSWRKIDDYTYETVAKLKGQTLTIQRTVVARDGKSRTNTVTGKNAQGQAINNVAVYERQ